MKKSLQKIDPAVERILAEYREAMRLAKVAVERAIYVGQLLNEQKALVGHGHWLPWLAANCPEISQDTARRWMDAAEAVLTKALKLPPVIEALPLSQVISTPEEELPEAAREARQLVFDFTAGKTIKECLAAVVVEGDEPHRITRAHNGRTQGGSRGEDRKDWPKFVGLHLSDISAHLDHWKQFTGAQVETVEAKFKAAVGKWPSPLLESLKRAIAEELKTR